MFKIFGSAESVFDIAEMVIAESGLRKPEEYRECIEILGEAGILPAAFTASFAPLAGFRNILVREYAKIDLKEVHRHLQESLDDFERFAGFIAGYLNRHS